MISTDVLVYAKLYYSGIGLCRDERPRGTSYVTVRAGSLTALVVWRLGKKEEPAYLA